jgi:hypothetical protein
MHTCDQFNVGASIVVKCVDIVCDVLINIYNLFSNIYYYSLY